MLEITARIHGRSVFLAGETIDCHVTVANVIRPSHDKTNGSIGTNVGGKLKPVKLAWVTAQIHCQCSVSENRILLPVDMTHSTNELTGINSETSFVPFKGEKGSTVLATKPVILICDLSLMPNESCTFVYSETLPVDAPPSYRGVALKYSYKITIGAQRFGFPTKLVRLPFRILVVPGLEDMSVYDMLESGAALNPFHDVQKSKNSLLDIALENLQTITCRKGPSLYNITNTRGKVAQFCLFKQAYRIGDDVVGTCDFGDSTVPCMKFSVTLQSDEQISENCHVGASAGATPKTSSSGGSSSGSSVSTVTSYSRHEEFSLCTLQTHISISIPLTATPSFISDLVSLKWRLHFEFVTSKTALPRLRAPSKPDCDALWHGPPQLDVETMVWDLPIKVFATNPAFVSSVSQLRTEASCTL